MKEKCQRTWDATANVVNSGLDIQKVKEATIAAAFLSKHWSLKREVHSSGKRLGY